LSVRGEFGDGDGQINGPSGIDFDSDDNAFLSVHVDGEDLAYITESRRHRFQIYERG